jgi:Fe-Mn family superoxide dismutase
MSGKIILENGLKAAVNVGSSKLPSEVLKSSTALLSSLAAKPHVLPDLSYDYDALEPALSAETMTIHHSKVKRKRVNSLPFAEFLFIHCYSRPPILF